MDVWGTAFLAEGAAVTKDVDSTQRGNWGVWVTETAELSGDGPLGGALARIHVSILFQFLFPGR